MLSMAALGLSVLPGGAADAATGPPVPVAGVAAFGIGAGQLGNTAGCFGAPCEGGVVVDAKGDLLVADSVNGAASAGADSALVTAGTGAVLDVAAELAGKPQTPRRGLRHRL
jgi:hypothetical protein